MCVAASPTFSLLTCLLCIYITCVLCNANVVLIPTPSRTIPIGKSLKLSCIVTNRKLPVMWRKDGGDIGEDCKPYLKNGFTCETETNGDTTTYNLKIKAITSADAGNWSCSHGLRSVETIEINVAIPTKVHPLKVYPLLPQSGSTSLVHGSSSLQSRQPVPLNGAGTLKHPIDLTTSSSTDGPRDWVVHCSSTCGSSARDLRWELLNKTWLGHLNLPNAPMLSNDCPHGQYRLRRNIIFSCLHDKSYVLGKRSQHHALVGLNRLICTPNHGNLTDLIEASHVLTGADNTYFHWHRHYTSSLWPVNHRFSTAAGDGTAQQEEQFDCTTRTDELPFACVHILCPGNPTEWFTWGERVALVVSAVLFLMFCLFLCYLTRHRKQAKGRSNIAPGQQHEVELML